MFEQFRLILVTVSLLIFVYGGWVFWSGKEIVEQKRRIAKPHLATLDDLVLNPPRKNGEWYQITDGGASIPRSVLEDYGAGPNPIANAPFFLYIPILRNKDAAKAETVAQLNKKRPQVAVLLRSQNREHKQTYSTMMQLQSAGNRTTNEWLLQNHKQLVIAPPFTGLLVRRDNNRRSVDSQLETNLKRMNADYQAEGWILIEGEKPEVGDDAQLVIGLMLLMGVPTVWLFGLLFAGKLDPPDDEPPTRDSSAKPVDSTMPIPGSFVMPSTMPVAVEPDMKKPRR